MSINSGELVRALIENFKILNQIESTPAWAWPYPPSVPFVGLQYEPGKGLLVYASAENLSWMSRKPIPARFTDDRAWDRYRAQVEEDRPDPSGFFPNLGIAPMTNGLLAPALFVAMKRGLPTSDSPWDFLETIAASNVAKFCIRGEANTDYIGDRVRTVESVSYLVHEISVLQPRITMVPAAIWKDSWYRRAVRGASPATRVLPVPQFNPQVIHTHLAKLEGEATALRTANHGTPLGDWMEHVRGCRKDAAWRYLAALDGLLGGVAA